MTYAGVSSSWVAALGYEPATKTLGLKTRSGKEYRYRGVPRFVWLQLLDAASKGKALNRLILDRYAVSGG